MSHGYFKASGKPQMMLCHGTVGLQHAAMAIYNAYCDRVPIVVMAGNFRDQPAIELFPHRVSEPLTNAELIMTQSFFIGNHHQIGERERAYVKESVDEFMSRWA